MILAQAGTHHSRRRFDTPLTLTVMLAVFLAILWGAPGIDRQVQWGLDFCYQLNMGRQLLLGKRAFVDFFFHYGPLVACTSALGLTLHDSIVPETIFCALGYSAAIALSFAVARRLAGLLPALGLAAVQFLLMSRFYKWYYWLFPVLMVVLLMRLGRHRRPAAGALFLGLAAGVAFLYRIDLGIGCLVMALAGAGILMLNRLPLRTLLRAHARILTGFLVPPALWVAWLTFHSGPAATRDYFRSYLDAATGVTRHMGQPVPELTWQRLQHPLVFENATALAFRVLPGIALCGLAAALWLIVRRRADLRARLMGVVCLGALVIFPQALHRSCAHHLLQVLPLFALATVLVLGRLFGTALQPLPVRVCRRLAVVMTVAVLALVVLGLRPVWLADLQFSGDGPPEKFRRLAAGVGAASPSDAARAIGFVREHTTPDDAVLPLSVGNNFLFFTGRRAAGLVPCYVPGLLTEPSWQLRNLRQIAADRPKYVLLAGPPVDDKPENTPPRYLPRLWAVVEQDYPAVVFQSGTYVVRAREQ